MGIIQDLLTEVPLSAVMRERVALAEEKYERATKESEGYKQRIAALEHEIEILRALVPSQSAGELGADTTRVLVYFFKAPQVEQRDVGNAARAMNMERNVLQYHLDRLKDAGLAQSAGGNYLHGHSYWALTSDGRRHVVENKLV